MAPVDAISGFLGGPRARGAFVLRAVMAAPWSIRVEDEAPLSVVVLLKGSAWITGADNVAQPFRTGQVALLRGPDPYLFADEPDTEPQIRILPGQECVSATGEHLDMSMDLGVRSWGNSRTGGTELLIGSYLAKGEISGLLTVALPPVAIVGGDGWQSAVLPILTSEADRDRPGQQVVLDRLLDLLVIDAVRNWFDRAEVPSPSWYSAQTDPTVGPALRLLHADPRHGWTVAELASRVGMSRAGFARRFTDLVGQPPMSYLTQWRLATAADLLLEPAAAVGSVARQVGYDSPFTFSTAFKRFYGHSPKQHHRLAAG